MGKGVLGREIKFSYLQQHDETGRIVDTRLTLEEIEAIDGIVYRGYTLVARRQYTGLKDRNGKEIFEGDVVRLSRWGDGAVSEIRWDDEDAAWGIWPNHGIEDRYDLVQKAIRGAEVIGNVWEHPELLEVQS